jgi:hypothetical protein
MTAEEIVNGYWFHAVQREVICYGLIVVCLGVETPCMACVGNVFWKIKNLKSLNQKWFSLVSNG